MEPRRPRASTPAASGESAADTANGCAKWAVFVIVAIIGCSALAVWLGDDTTDDEPPNMIRMTGTIRLSASQCSFEQQVRINPRNRAPVFLRMDGNSYRPGQPCNLTIDTMVEQATSYEIDVKDVGKEVFPHKLIDTRDASGRVILEFTLSFR